MLKKQRRNSLSRDKHCALKLTDHVAKLMKGLSVVSSGISLILISSRSDFKLVVAEQILYFWQMVKKETPCLT